jgi:hypothetical protein
MLKVRWHESNGSMISEMGQELTPQYAIAWSHKCQKPTLLVGELVGSRHSEARQKPPERTKSPRWALLAAWNSDDSLR